MRKLVLLLALLASTSSAAAPNLSSAEDFQITCLATPTLIVAPTLREAFSIYCQFPAVTPVHLGGPSVNLDAPSFCDDSACLRADWPYDARGVYCIAGTSTVITCIGAGL